MSAIPTLASQQQKLPWGGGSIVMRPYNNLYKRLWGQAGMQCLHASACPQH